MFVQHHSTDIENCFLLFFLYNGEKSIKETGRNRDKGKRNTWFFGFVMPKQVDRKVKGEICSDN